MFCIKGILGNFAKFTGKHPLESFNKVSSLRPATLLKKRLWHRCFPVSFEKFLRTPFCIEHLWWLFLKKAPFSGLILDTYCVRYPHAMPFLNFFLNFLRYPHFKFACSLGGFHLWFALYLLKYSLFWSYCTHTLSFWNMSCF